MRSLSVSSDRAPCSLFRAETEVGELPASPGRAGLPPPGARVQGGGPRPDG